MTLRHFNNLRSWFLACFLLPIVSISFAADAIRTERVHLKKGTNRAVIEASYPHNVIQRGNRRQ